jgi:hypothetical protein
MMISKNIRIFSLFLLLAGLSLGASVNAISVNSSVINPVNASIFNLTISLNVYPTNVVRGGIIAFELKVSGNGRLALLPPPTVCSASDPKCFGKLSRYCSMMPVKNSTSYYCVYNSLRNSPGNYTVVASAKDKSGKIVTSMPVNFSIVSRSMANITNATRSDFSITTAYATLVRLYSKSPALNASSVSR